MVCLKIYFDHHYLYNLYLFDSQLYVYLNVNLHDVNDTLMKLISPDLYTLTVTIHLYQLIFPNTLHCGQNVVYCVEM